MVWLTKKRERQEAPSQRTHHQQDRARGDPGQGRVWTGDWLGKIRPQQGWGPKAWAAWRACQCLLHTQGPLTVCFPPAPLSCFLKKLCKELERTIIQEVNTETNRGMEIMISSHGSLVPRIPTKVGMACEPLRLRGLWVLRWHPQVYELGCVPLGTVEWTTSEQTLSAHKNWHRCPPGPACWLGAWATSPADGNGAAGCLHELSPALSLHFSINAH